MSYKRLFDEYDSIDNALRLFNRFCEDVRAVRVSVDAGVCYSAFQGRVLRLYYAGRISLHGYRRLIKTAWRIRFARHAEFAPDDGWECAEEDLWNG